MDMWQRERPRHRKCVLCPWAGCLHQLCSLLLAAPVSRSQLVLGSVLVPGKQEMMLAFAATGNMSGHVGSHWLELFILTLPQSATHLPQDLSCSARKRASEKPAALNINTMGKKVILVCASCVAGCLDQYHLISL